MISFLLPVIVLAVVLVVTLNRKRFSTGDASTGSLRQLFFYLFAFAALLVAVNGISILVTYIVDSLRGGQFVEPDESQLALGLALTLVGGPAWLFAWVRIQKSVATDPEQSRFFVRGLYLYVIAAIAISFFAAGLISLINTILGGDELRGTYVARPVAWGGVWAYHWWVESRVSPQDRAATPFRGLYVYIVAAASLGMLLSGVALVLERLFNSAYTSLFLDDLIVSASLWSDGMKTVTSIAIVGAIGWWWHWHRAAAADVRDTIRLVYIYLFGVLGGMVTIVVSLSILLVAVLQWLFGAPDLPPAAEHFQLLTGVIPALIAGGFLWAYHAATLRGEAVTGDEAASIRRVYNYLLTSASLATLAIGLVFLVALAVTSTAGEDYLVEDRGWQGQLSITLTLLGVGGGLWAYYWSRAEKSVTAFPAERDSLSRRVHIYSVFGASALAALGSLSAVLYLLLEAILGSGVSAGTFDDMKWGLGVLLAAGIISGYFWFIIREDRSVLATVARPAPVIRKRVTLLAPAGAVEQARRLEALLGSDVTTWTSHGAETVPALTDEQLAAVTEQVISAPPERVLVILDHEGAHVLPYTRD